MGCKAQMEGLVLKRNKDPFCWNRKQAGRVAAEVVGWVGSWE